MSDNILSLEEQRFLNLIHKAEAADTPAYIGAMSILYMGAGDLPAPFEGIYSRGDFKRAIKRLRVLQQDKPQCAHIYEEAIAFIRCKWLHMEVDL